MKKIINVSFFIIILSSFFFAYFIQYDFEQPLSYESIESLYAEDDVFREELIDLYGFVQRAAGKRAIENFTLYKNDYEKIVSPKPEKSPEEIAAAIQSVMPVFECLKEKEIPYYYLTGLLPIVREADLPVGVLDYSEENAAILLQKLEELQLPVIDLRTQKQTSAIEKEERFYRTDHHWSLQACFAAFQEVIWKIEKDLAWELEAKREYTAAALYDEWTIEDCFLGSYGIKVGEYYAGKDDFTVFIPRFDTNLTFEAYDARQNLLFQKNGQFKEALLEQPILNDAEYHNKYNAFLNNSAIENRIVNHISENEKKVLLVAHSYGRPLLQYLSLCFGEVRMLDPQAGRFDGDYLSYIEEYNPDIVLFLIEFEGEIIGEYRVE